jgi:hypothetical protein
MPFVGWALLVYLIDTTLKCILKHYGPCGLDSRLIQYLEELPRHLHLRLGKSEDFWREELDSPLSKLHRLDLINGGISYAVKLARHNSERTGTGICRYLRESIERDWILNWLTQYIRSMLSQYYNLP